MVNKKFIILMGLQWGKASQVTPSGFINHIANRCISAAGWILDCWAGDLDAKNVGLTHIFNKKKKV